jgi:hypothetical protein
MEYLLSDGHEIICGHGGSTTVPCPYMARHGVRGGIYGPFRPALTLQGGLEFGPPRRLHTSQSACVVVS